MTLVIEFLEKDLKRYMEDCNNVLSLNNVKVRGRTAEVPK